MRYLKAVALLLVIVGAVNWLLVGIAQFDLVAAITGDTFGETNPSHRSCTSWWACPGSPSCRPRLLAHQ